MRIARYLLARLGGVLVVMAIVAVLVFVLTRAAPGDPISVLLGDQANAEDIARVQKVYGLDRPLPVQFGLWLRELAHGNLGESIFLQRPVTQALWERAEPTALLSLMAIAIAALIGVPCGIVSAVYRGSAIDQACTGFAMLGPPAAFLVLHGIEARVKRMISAEFNTPSTVAGSTSVWIRAASEAPGSP